MRVARSGDAATPAELRPLLGLPGVGPKLAELLADKLNLRSLGDLWFHLPLHYQDRTRLTAIADVRVGAAWQVEGVIEHAEVVQRGRRSMLAVLRDGSGLLRLRFFYFQNAQLDKFKLHPRVRCFGEVRLGSLGLEIVHPQIKFLLDTDAVAPVSEALSPVYPKTDAVSAERIANTVRAALRELPAADELELLPPGLREQLRWPELRRALEYVHAPPPDADLNALELRMHPAQRRLAAEELLAHQLSMRLLRRTVDRRRSPVLRGPGALAARLVGQLQFALTGAQNRVMQEVQADMARSQPMLRMVQGDVGSGKTIVAALCAAHAVECGMQVALVAPTELLAEQHFRNFQRWFEPLGVELVWLAGKVQGKARARALAAIASSAQIVIGTHALISEAVHFRQLGFCIVDEQHRFGVRQRLSLSEKGSRDGLVPHQLVMTATPIPRTLAMVAYADLEVSVIDELPPGRKPIQTVVLGAERKAELIERIRLACGQGRQAYWVCTLIEENDLLEAQAAQSAAEQLTQNLPELRIGLVHGRLKAAEKDRVMQAFSRGELDLLVATTVIEVGVDVPNASLMLIENAERLGLSQLHQLRGRVGRGSTQSTCVLIYQAPLSQIARARLQILRESSDGFLIAERDLELRGPGELLGTRQAGYIQFRIADLSRDADLLDSAKFAADYLMREAPKQAEALVRRWIGNQSKFSNA